MQRRGRIAEIREAMDVPSGNFLVRICLIVALTNGAPSEKWQKKYRLAADSGGKAITQRSLEKKSIKRDDRKENTKHY